MDSHARLLARYEQQSAEYAALVRTYRDQIRTTDLADAERGTRLEIDRRARAEESSAPPSPSGPPGRTMVL